MASRCRRFDNASDVVERTSARARASCVPLAPAWRTPLRRRRATRDVARNLRPPRSHARRARRPRVTLCRATLFPPSTFRGRTAFEREFRHSRTAPVACCDHVLFDLPETTTHAVDSPRARRIYRVRRGFGKVEKHMVATGDRSRSRMAKLSLESCASPKRRRGKERRAAQRNARATGPTRVTSRRAQVPRHVARGTSPAKRRAPCRRKRYARSTRARARPFHDIRGVIETAAPRRHPDGAPPLSLERRRTRRTRHRPSPRSRRAWVT